MTNNNDPFQQDKRNVESDWKRIGKDLYSAIDEERDRLYRKIKADSGRTSIRRKVKRETQICFMVDGFRSLVNGLKTFKFW